MVEWIYEWFLVKVVEFLSRWSISIAIIMLPNIWSSILCVGCSFSQLLFKFCLEHAIRKVQENHVRLKLNGTHQLLIYADDVNLLRDDMNTINKTETPIDVSKYIGLELRCTSRAQRTVCDDVWCCTVHACTGRNGSAYSWWGEGRIGNWRGRRTDSEWERQMICLLRYCGGCRFDTASSHTCTVHCAREGILCTSGLEGNTEETVYVDISSSESREIS
jgi:hypothetical protein